MNPHCKFGLSPEAHHIVPLSKGGIDEESNYIVLCWPCHHLAKRHSKYYEQEIILATWKYYYESLFESASKGNEISNEKIRDLDGNQKELISRRRYGKLPQKHGKNIKPDLPVLGATMPFKQEIVKMQEILQIEWKAAKIEQKRPQNRHKVKKPIKYYYESTLDHSLNLERLQWRITKLDIGID